LDLPDLIASEFGIVQGGFEVIIAVRGIAILRQESRVAKLCVQGTGAAFPDACSSRAMANAARFRQDHTLLLPLRGKSCAFKAVTSKSMAERSRQIGSFS
jgi:hypothetical protein